MHAERVLSLYSIHFSTQSKVEREGATERDRQTDRACWSLQHGNHSTMDRPQPAHIDYYYCYYYYYRILYHQPCIPFAVNNVSTRKGFRSEESIFGASDRLLSPHSRRRFQSTLPPPPAHGAKPARHRYSVPDAAIQFYFQAVVTNSDLGAFTVS